MVASDTGPCVIGLDVGTQGARALAVAGDGRVLAAASRRLPAGEPPVLPAGWSEQDPASWWGSAGDCLREVAAAIAAESVSAIAVTSTSGTVVPVDGAGEPLRPAILYNDGRAVEDAAVVQAAGCDLAHKLGYTFQASFALPRLLWLRRHERDVFERAACFLHAADFLVMRLTGEIGLSDSSNALKTGYDLQELRWGDWIERDLGIPLSKLPRVAQPGDAIGAVSPAAAAETGLHAGTPVVAGATDGTAAFLASGAFAPGDWNVTLGTTLVVRGVSPELVRDPGGGASTATGTRRATGSPAAPATPAASGWSAAFATSTGLPSTAGRSICRRRRSRCTRWCAGESAFPSSTRWPRGLWMPRMAPTRPPSTRRTWKAPPVSSAGSSK